MGGLIAFAGDLDPPKGPIGPTMHTLDEIYAAVSDPQCCSPRPEDIRTYSVVVPNPNVPPETIIPKVEGPNGFVLTDIIGILKLTIFEDTGEGPVEIFHTSNSDGLLNFTTGVPLVAGSTISLTSESGSELITFIGYVY